MKMKIFKAIFFAFPFFAAVVLGVPANAQSPADWKPASENLAGLDGVSMRCVISSDRKFVHEMCGILTDAAEEKASRRGLKIASAGITWERNPDDAYKAAVAAQEISNPLLLEFFIRGTDGDPVSGAVHILASIQYKAAIEQGSDNSKPRSGRLVIWENAGTGSGPANQLGAALGKHMAKKLDLLFGEF